MKPGRAAAAATVLLLAACGGGARPRNAGRPPSWRTIATEEDRKRLSSWRAVWIAALVRATSAHGAAIADAGATLQPDAALDDAAPPPGEYRCRAYRLGGKTPLDLDYAIDPETSCGIAREAGTFVLATLTGAQRPNGTLYPDGDRRMVFLGTMTFSDETTALRYGRDRDRDMIGGFERIGANRWRLVLPSPRWEAMLEVIELVPGS